MKKQKLVAILWVLCLFITSCENKTQEKPPNLLFIFPDQLRNASIGINNQDPVFTPYIDQLGKEGLVISNAISNFPLCSPYRGMLMTGKLPYNNNVLSNANSKRYKYNNSWQKKDVSFSDVLVENGYETGYVGKLHLTSPAPLTDSTLVVWDAYTPKDERHGFKFWYSYGTFDEHNTPHYWVNDAKEDEQKEVKQWSAEHEADVIIDYLKNPSRETRDASKPFALFWSVNPPHPPYHLFPKKYLDPYKNTSSEALLVRDNVITETNKEDFAFHSGATSHNTGLVKEHVRNYFAMITGVDDQIGRVLKTLKEEQLDENTIVVLTSDHGEMMGSHGLMSKNIWFEEALNIPFIIRWPKKIKAHQTSDLLIGATDVMPTILAMMGVKKGMPSDLDGKNLSSQLLNQTGENPQSVLYYFIEEGNPASGHRGIRTHQYTYVVTIGRDDKERKFLYDNKKDPYQLKNIITENKALQQELHNALLKELKQKNDPWLKSYYKRVNQADDM